MSSEGKNDVLGAPQQQQQQPYLFEELQQMSCDEIIELHRQKSPRVLPHCLIGMHIDVARSQVHKWVHPTVSRHVHLLVCGQDASLGDMSAIEYWCTVDDETGTITEVEKLQLE